MRRLLTALAFSLPLAAQQPPAWLRWVGQITSGGCGPAGKVQRAGTGFILKAANGKAPLIVTSLHLVYDCRIVGIRFPKQDPDGFYLKPVLYNIENDVALFAAPGSIPPDVGFALPQTPGDPVSRDAPLFLYGFKEEAATAMQSLLPLGYFKIPLRELVRDYSETMPDRNALVYRVDFGPAKGSSGSPIANRRNEVVAILAGGKRGGSIGANFAIAVESWTKPGSLSNSWLQASDASVQARLEKVQVHPSLLFNAERDGRIKAMHIPRLSEEVEFVEVPSQPVVRTEVGQRQTLIMRMEFTQHWYAAIHRLPPPLPSEADLPVVADNDETAANTCDAFAAGMSGPTRNVVGRLPDVEEFWSVAGDPGPQAELACHYNFASSPSDSKCPDHARFAAAVSGRSPGDALAYDMYGNLWEWVTSQNGVMLAGGGFDTAVGKVPPKLKKAREALIRAKHYKGHAGFRCVLVDTDIAAAGSTPL